MKPLKFEEATVELTKPTSMSEDKCGSLYVHQTPDGQCVSLWTASFWQRLKFLFHGRLWIGIYSGAIQPPIWLDMTKTVFIKE